MAIQRQLRRGTTLEVDAFTGAIGETVYDTDLKHLVNNDGVTQGGIRLPLYTDIQSQYFQAVDGVGTNTVTLTLPYAPSAYAEYQRFTFKPAANNTGAVTLNVNSLGAKDVKKDDGSGTLEALEADDLKTSIPVDVIYDGTQFILQLGGGGSGTYQLLSETNASSTSSIDFTSATISGYRRYEIHFSDVLPATSGASLGVRISTDGGSTFVNASQYFHMGRGSTNGTGFDINTTETLCSIDAGAGVRSGAANAIDGTIIITNPLSTGAHKHMFFKGNFVDTGNNFAYAEGAVYMGSSYNTVDIDGLQILFDSGNIASGNIKLYGIL